LIDPSLLEHNSACFKSFGQNAVFWFVLGKKMCSCHRSLRYHRYSLYPTSNNGVSRSLGFSDGDAAAINLEKLRSWRHTQGSIETTTVTLSSTGKLSKMDVTEISSPSRRRASSSPLQFATNRIESELRPTSADSFQQINQSTRQRSHRTRPYESVDFSCKLNSRFGLRATSLVTFRRQLNNLYTLYVIRALSTQVTVTNHLLQKSLKLCFFLRQCHSSLFVFFVFFCYSFFLSFPFFFIPCAKLS